MLDDRLLQMLACPAPGNAPGDSACHGHLLQKGSWLQCERCGLFYPIEQGIPVMLLERAVHVAPDETIP